MHVREMIASHPSVRGNVNEALLGAIEACDACAHTGRRESPGGPILRLPIGDAAWRASRPRGAEEE